MTTIENLEIVKAALLEKRDAVELAHSALEKEAKEEKKAIFEKLFEEEISYHPEVEISVGSSSISFSIEHREIASICERSYWRTEDTDRRFYFNTYATMCETEFEFKRLIFNGRIAGRMLTDMDSIKAAFITPFSKKLGLDGFAAEYQILTSEIRSKDNQISALRREEFTQKLHGEGAEWNPGKTFVFNRQWSSYQVKKVRVIKATKSGKTADLEVTYGTWDYVYDDEGNGKRVDKEDRVVTHEGIKMDYVLGNFRDQLYS
jgi:hypothetical protein